MAEALGARRLLDITGAHIDSCLYHGQSGVDFAERIIAGDARGIVPSTLNVSSLDLLHPELYRGDQPEAQLSRRLMALYEQMGCQPTWTCPLTPVHTIDGRPIGTGPTTARLRSLYDAAVEREVTGNQFSADT